VLLTALRCKASSHPSVQCHTERNHDELAHYMATCEAWVVGEATCTVERGTLATIGGAASPPPCGVPDAGADDWKHRSAASDAPPASGRGGCACPEPPPPPRSLALLADA